MPEYIRALIVLSALATVVFYFVKAPATAVAMSIDDFVRRRNAWICITLAGFLSQNYWVFAVIVSLLIYNAAKKDSNKIAFFFFLLLAVPQISVEIPGFAGIRYFFLIDYVRILTAIVLLPVCIKVRKQATEQKSKAFLPDKVLAAYIILNLIIQAQYDIATNVVRSTLNWVIDVVVPYYAISRSIKDQKSLTEVLMSFVVAATFVSVVGFFEFLRHWVLYLPMADALGVDWTSNYLSRGDALRARATSGHPIVFGYVTCIALIFWVYIKNQIPNRAHSICIALALAAGAIASISRGPWVGLAIGMIMVVLTAPNVWKNLIRLSLAGFAVLGGLMVVGYAEKIISFLPFVGNVEEENITYRARLFDSAYQIILDNPFFGSNDYLLQMEDMKQGEGIIDLVNTFLIVGLNSGLVGLGLFLTFFAWIIFSIYRVFKSFDPKSNYFRTGQVVFAALIGIMVTISTVSPIFHVPVLYWSVAAMGVAYIKMKKAVP
jgi:O-antigen ligase